MTVHFRRTPVLIVLTMGLWALSPAAPGETLPFAPLVIPAGFIPESLTAGDLNADGIVDFVIPDATDGVYISLGLGGGRFAPKFLLAVGTRPTSAVLGDFDGDGRIDLVVTLYGSNQVGVFRGHNDGTFEAPVRLAAGTGPYRVTIHDFNRDGLQDLAVANLDSDDVSILPGIAGGWFASQIRSTAGDQPVALGAGDFDGNGLPDLAVANFLAGTVSILRGRGNGSFDAPAAVTVGSLPRSIVTMDFNGDRFDDIAVASRNGGDVSVLLGVPQGGLPSARRYPVGGQTTSLAACDCNGDGHTDLAATNLAVDYPTGDVALLFGRGDGSFALGASIEVGDRPSFIVSAPVNQDGLDDLAVLGRKVVELLVNPGGSRFGFANRFATESVSEALAIGDLNRDGRLDVVSVGRPLTGMPARSSVLLGSGDGSFQSLLSLDAGPGPRAATLADFNGDGALDLAVAYDVLDQLAVLLGAGDGTFGVPEFFATGHVPLNITAGDFNADGYQDLAARNAFSEDLSILLGRGDGRFDPQPRVSLGHQASGPIVVDLNRDGAADLAFIWDGYLYILSLYPYRQFFPVAYALPDAGLYELSAGDINLDGTLDLVALSGSSGFVSVFLSRSDGSFDTIAPVSWTPGKRPVIAEFTGDGLPDVVTFGGSPGLFLLPGHGDGTFDPFLALPAALGQSDVQAGDFNADGRQDLAVATGFQSVYLVLSAGGGVMGNPTRIPAGGAVQPVIAADINEDGIADLAAVGPRSSPFVGQVAVHLGTGEGLFQPLLSFDASTNPTDLAIGDFNLDGHVDLAVACSGFESVNPPFPPLLYPGELSILQGGGDGTFVKGPSVSQAGQYPSQVEVADLNLDGLDDLIIGSSRSQSVSSFPGRGDGSFGPVMWSVTGIGPLAMKVADLDGDGLYDLAVARKHLGPLVNQLQIYRGRGDGGFNDTMGYPFGTERYPADLQVADVNSDGLLDLIMADQGPAFGRGAVLVFMGLGQGSFGAGTEVPAGGRPASVAVADFTLDGVLDIAAANLDGYATLLTGIGYGAFSQGIHFSVGGVPSHLAALDFSGDGAPDLVATLPDAKMITLLPNRLTPHTNHPPVAAAGPDIVETCVAPPGVVVTLNGAGSSDPDSTPGSHDDISRFEWFEDWGLPSQALLGEGETLTLIMAPGTHIITLRVTDSAGATDDDQGLVSITEAAPQVTVGVTPSTLWPPNHRLVAIRAVVSVSASCSTSSIALASVVSSEPDDAAGHGDGATIGDIRGADAGSPDFEFELRAERIASGGGRTYTLTYRSTSATGVLGTGSAVVSVPESMSGSTDPLAIEVTQDASGTVLSWTAVPGASLYRVVRGEIGNLSETSDAYETGPLICIASSTPRTDTSGAGDADAPPAGKGFFYVVEYDDGLSSGYGTESASKPFAGGTNGCPGGPG